MALSTMAVIYTTLPPNNLLRIIIPDDDAALIDGTHRPMPGETMLVLPTGPTDTATLQALIALHVANIGL